MREKVVIVDKSISLSQFGFFIVHYHSATTRLYQFYLNLKSKVVIYLDFCKAFKRFLVMSFSASYGLWASLAIYGIGLGLPFFLVSTSVS